MKRKNLTAIVLAGLAASTFNPTVSEAQAALNCTGNQQVVHTDIKADAHVDDLRQETIYKNGKEQTFTLGGSADLTGIIINPAPGTNWENGYINYPDGTTTIGEFDIQNVVINGNNISWDQCLEGNQEFIFPAYIQNGKTIGTTANIGYIEACGDKECITQVFPVSKEDTWKGWNEGGVNSGAEQARLALQGKTREIVTGLDLYTVTGEPFDANTINITRGDAGVFLLKTGSTFIKALSKGQIMSTDDQNVRVVDNIAYTIGPNATICPLAEEFIINGINRLSGGCVTNLNQYEEQPFTQKRVLNADLTGPTTNDFRQETYGVIKDAEIITTGTFADKINTATAGNTTAFSVTYDKNSVNLRTEFWQNGGLVSIIDGNPADTILNNADTEIRGYLLDHKENPLKTYTANVQGIPQITILGIDTDMNTNTIENPAAGTGLANVVNAECDKPITYNKIITNVPGNWNGTPGPITVDTNGLLTGTPTGTDCGTTHNETYNVTNGTNDSVNVQITVGAASNPTNDALAYVNHWLTDIKSRHFLSNNEIRAMINGGQGTQSYARQMAEIFSRSPANNNGTTVDQLEQFLYDLVDGTDGNGELWSAFDPIQYDNDAQGDFDEALCPTNPDKCRAVVRFYGNPSGNPSDFPLIQEDMQAMYELIRGIDLSGNPNGGFLVQYVKSNADDYGGTLGGSPDLSFNPTWNTQDPN